MEPESDLSDASPMLPLRPAVNFSRLANRTQPVISEEKTAPTAKKTVVLPLKRSTAPSMLRVTPVAIPSLPTINQKVQSLLSDAKVSHYNYQMGSYRIPHKYDHFHVKTYEINFVPTFNFDRFERRAWSGSADQTESLTRALNRMKEYHVSSQKPEEKRVRRRTRRYFRSSHSPPVTEKRSSKPHSPVNTSQSPIRLEKRKVRAVVCVQDGSAIGSPDLRSIVLDLQTYFDKYIGYSAHGAGDEERCESLAAHGLMEVLEAGSKALKPDRSFTALYTVGGEPVEEITKVPDDCQALVFGWKEGFLGLGE